jgi:DNA-directed RNA polymerase specialized sigma24 family protein
MADPHNRSGVEELIQELLPVLHKTAYYLSSDEHEAEDAVQETLARLLQALETTGADPSATTVRAEASK